MSPSSQPCDSGLAVHFDSGAGLPEPKKRKIDIACEPCRTRKARCDGKRPIPVHPGGKRRGPAHTQHDESAKYIHYNETYVPEPRNTYLAMKYPPEAPNLNSMRVPGYCDIPGQVTVKPQSEFSISTAPSDTPALDVHVPQKSGIRTVFAAPAGTGPHAQNLPTMECERQEDSDAMGNIDDYGLRRGLLGASSSANFMQFVASAVDGTITPNHDRLNTQLASSHASSTEIYRKATSRINVQSSDFVLPPKKTADRLLDIHWELSQSIFPWLDRLRLVAWYEGLWTGHGTLDPCVDEQVYYCILNTAFAMSYKLDATISPEEQENLSNAHFERAQKLLSFNLLEISDIGVVQALLLMAQYLQSTNMPRQCYQCVGPAIWIAQDMGLHLPESASCPQSQHDHEIARRAWHGCILMDRIMAMVFGRPTRISQQIARQSPMPTAIDDEYLAFDGGVTGHQPVDQPSKLGIFVAYCRLHIILGEVLSTFHAVNTPSVTPIQMDHAQFSVNPTKQNIDTLLQVDHSLECWRASLEPHLQINKAVQNYDEANRIFRRQAIVLYVHFLYIRILLYRPFFSRSARTAEFTLPDRSASNGSDLAKLIICHGLAGCVRAAQELLEFISTSIRSDEERELLSPWWYVMSYVYTAGTITVAAHSFPSVMEQISTSALSNSIRQALDILQSYEGGRVSVQRCKAALRSFYDKILSAESRRELSNSTFLTSDCDASSANGRFDFGPGANLVPDTNTWNIFDATDFPWLNNAPFNGENEFWL